MAFLVDLDADYKLMSLIPVTPDLAIDESEVLVSYARASGPGGQNAFEIAPFKDTFTVSSIS